MAKNLKTTKVQHCLNLKQIANSFILLNKPNLCLRGLKNVTSGTGGIWSFEPPVPGVAACKVTSQARRYLDSWINRHQTSVSTILIRRYSDRLNIILVWRRHFSLTFYSSLQQMHIISHSVRFLVLLVWIFFIMELNHDKIIQQLFEQLILATSPL